MSKRQLADEKVSERYDARNYTLEQLGFRCYAEYLKSDTWKDIRAAVLSNKPFCICCSRPAQVVHHVKYTPDVLLGINNSRLAPLCHGCHELIEIDKQGRKRRMGTANTMLFEMARKTAHGLEWCDRYYKACSESKKYLKAAAAKGMLGSKRGAWS